MNAHHVNRLLRPWQTDKALQPPEQRKSESVGSEAQDQVTISTQAQAALRLRDAITGLSDVRTDKVSILREAIAKGTYHVPAQKIAAKMLGISGEEE